MERHIVVFAVGALFAPAAVLRFKQQEPLVNLSDPIDSERIAAIATNFDTT
jgi:hypothetical protein